MINMKKKKFCYTFDKWLTLVIYEARVNQKEKGGIPKERRSKKKGA